MYEKGKYFQKNNKVNKYKIISDYEENYKYPVMANNFVLDC